MTEKLSEPEAEKLLANLDSELRQAIPELVVIPDLFEGTWEDPIIVLDFIQAEVAEGRPVVRKVRVANGEVDRITGQERASHGASVELTGSQPYTSVEQLALTTEALALAFVSPVQMASKLLSTLSDFRDQDGDDISVKFAAKKEQLPEPAFELDALQVDIARGATRPLAIELKKLSDSVGGEALNLSLGFGAQ